MTLGGGFMNNPGRYLALTPPINGATAASGSPYFTQQPGQKLYQWDTQLNLQYMPRDWITWWTEATFRHSDVRYWTGTGGVTPPGGNNGSPGSCVGGGANAATGQCSAGDWYPDLRTREVIWGAGQLPQRTRGSSRLDGSLDRRRLSHGQIVVRGSVSG